MDEASDTDDQFPDEMMRYHETINVIESASEKINPPAGNFSLYNSILYERAHARFKGLPKWGFDEQVLISSRLND